jgi:hypothetical protein
MPHSQQAVATPAVRMMAMLQPGMVPTIVTAMMPRSSRAHEPHRPRLLISSPLAAPVATSARPPHMRAKQGQTPAVQTLLASRLDAAGVPQLRGK